MNPESYNYKVIQAWTQDDTKEKGVHPLSNTIVYDVSSKLIFEPWMSLHLEHLSELTTCKRSYIQHDIPTTATEFISTIRDKTFFDIITITRMHAKRFLCAICHCDIKVLSEKCVKQLVIKLGLKSKYFKQKYSFVV